MRTRERLRTHRQSFVDATRRRGASKRARERESEGVRMSERERENLLSVVCGHDKTFDNLCHLGCVDAKSDSERARERESERARGRESERAKERESERARERAKERKRAHGFSGKNPSSVLCGHVGKRDRENQSSSFVDT